MSNTAIIRMRSLRPILLSTLVSVAAGVALFHGEIAFIDAALVTFAKPLEILPRRWQEIICVLFLTTLFGIPIAAVAKKDAAWFGALAAITTDAVMFAYWLQASPPRAVYSSAYYISSMLYALVFALISLAWWKCVFSKFSIQNQPSHPEGG